jgi:hypothetical protein
MKTLGNIFLVLGVLLCLTIFGVFWGAMFIVGRNVYRARGAGA